MVHFDSSKPLVLTTDASEYGIGAVLSHTTTDSEHPIACYSRALSFIIEPGNESCPAADFFNCAITFKIGSQILFQKWRSENYKFGFRIVDFQFNIL